MSHPVKLIVNDDLRRTRASVFFRLLLAIPHFVWLFLWGIAAGVVVVINWFATLFKGTSPQGLHGFLCDYLRYAIHVGAYVNLLADPYPKFGGDADYVVDLEVAPPQRQNRWTVFFRVVLAIPALLIGVAVTGGAGEGDTIAASFGGLLASVAFLGWFAALARAQMPRGMRDAGAYGLAYSAQLTAYLFILTDRYPDSDPFAALPNRPVHDYPLRLTADDDLRRSRLTVFFRLLLALPHLVWLTLWGIVALLAVIASWFATLATGRSPEALHNFLARYLRYQTHVYAFLMLTANPFPGFVGAAGSYPVDLVVAPPERQNRWTVGFRWVLAVPALLLSSAYLGLLYTVALLGWFSALARGRMPLGMRNAGLLSLRYSQQVNGYLLLLTAVYPYSGPTAAEPTGAEPPAVALPPDAIASPA